MKKLYALGAILGLLAFVTGECARREDEKYDAAAALSRAAKHSRDSILARNAERELRYMASNDSLKLILDRYKAKATPPLIRHDTVLMPVAEYVFITDSIMPKCIVCAARLDSLTVQAGDERRAADLLISRLQSDVGRERQKRERAALRSRFGISCGYGVVKIGADMKAGPGCMASVRVFP